VWHEQQSRDVTAVCAAVKCGTCSNKVWDRPMFHFFLLCKGLWGCVVVNAREGGWGGSGVVRGHGEWSQRA
jgi:hypothetical protein